MLFAAREQVSGLLTARRSRRSFSVESVMNQAVRQRKRATRVVFTSGRPETGDAISGASPEDDPVDLRLGRVRRRSRPRPRILVIEDDPYAREALSLLLDYYGYNVVTASNGADGLALVTDWAPDLVVTDWRMPGLSGLALCVALRELHDTMPIVVVTSAEEVFAYDPPVNARLRKPIDPPLLNRVITSELRAHRRR
jgi:CheY-like chemotaxis protein